MKHWMQALSRRKKMEFAVFFVILIVLYIIPLLPGTTDNSMRIAFNIAIYATLAQMWNLLCGHAGMLALGQQLFIGVSGFMTAIMCTTYGLPFAFAMGMSGLISAAFALFVSVLLLRMRGLYFAIATWVFAEMIKILFTGWGAINYSGGMTINVVPYPTLGQQFQMALSLAAAAFIIVYAILNSKLGLGLSAMRDDPDAAEGLGVSIFKSKTLTFVICGFVTGMCGSLIYLNKLSIFPNGAFSMDWTIAIVFSVIIGGIGTAAGPIVGGAIYVSLFNVLARYPGYSNVIMGIIAIAVIVTAPKGIVGTVQSIFKFELFSSNRPSLE